MGMHGCGSRRHHPAPVLLVATLLLVGPSAARGLDITLVPFATGLSTPVDIANAGDSRLFVVEKGGRIRIVQSDGTVLPGNFLDINGLVSSGGEQGLLGLAFHPNYAANGFFYVDYTDTSGDTVVARYSVSGDPNVADAGSAQFVLQVNQPFANHNGGDLNFGPNDGYLYISLGDGGGGCDPLDTGQDLQEHLGKILRIDVDSASPYAVPPSNPFAASPPAQPEIWAWGLRNPWRFSFDRANGNLYIGDVGQGAREEIDFQPAATTGGENYGWDCYEGTSLASASSGCSTTATCTPVSAFTFPAHNYAHSGGRCSVTGGFVYRGAASPALDGHYLFADFCSADFYSLTTPDNGSTWTLNAFGIPIPGLLPTSFGEDTAGEVYVAGGGALYHIQASTQPPDCPPTPAAGCTAAPKSRLTMKHPGDDTHKKLVWKWLSGPPTAQSGFGNPLLGTSYHLCVYNGAGAKVVDAGIAGVGGWKALSDLGYKFGDPSASLDGVFKALLKGSDSAKSKILVKARGANLDLDTLPLNESSQVTVQLIKNDGAECWEAVFPAASIAETGTVFKATIP